MEIPATSELKDFKLCSIPRCTQPRVYYCKSKKMTICEHCYQGYLLSEDVTVIEDHHRAQDIADKIHSWIEMLSRLGEKYRIGEFNHNYFDELKEFQSRLMNIKAKLTEAQKDTDYLLYEELKNEGISLFNELTSSKAMKSFSIHLGQSFINAQENENLNMTDDLIQSEIRDLKFDKMKENLVNEMHEQLELAIETERIRITKELEEKFDQTYQEQRSKIDELDKSIQTLTNDNTQLKKKNDELEIENISLQSEKNNLHLEGDNSKATNNILITENNDLKAEINILKSDKENLTNKYDSTITDNEILKAAKDNLDTQNKDLLANYDNLKLANSSLEDNLKSSEENFNSKIEKLIHENEDKFKNN